MNVTYDSSQIWWNVLYAHITLEQDRYQKSQMIITKICQSLNMKLFEVWPVSEELSGEIRSVQKGNLLTERDLSSKPDWYKTSAQTSLLQSHIRPIKISNSELTRDYITKYNFAWRNFLRIGVLEIKARLGIQKTVFEVEKNFWTMSLLSISILSFCRMWASGV